MTLTYGLGDALPGGELDGFPAGTSVLIRGPAMIGKRQLAIRMLAAGTETGDGLLVVTTRAQADSIVDELKRSADTFDPDRVGLIDCSGSEDRNRIRDVATERVGSPCDLTGISIGTAKMMKRFEHRNVTDVRHGLVSISTLLQYLDAETVFKFLHIYTNRVQSSDGLAVFTLDDDSHDQQTVNTMTGEFDGVVQLREADDGSVQYRVRGFGRSPSKWSALE